MSAGSRHQTRTPEARRPPSCWCHTGEPVSGGDQASRDDRTCGDADSPKQTKQTSQIKFWFGAPRRSRRRCRAREAREVVGAREAFVLRRAPLNAHSFSTKYFFAARSRRRRGAACDLPEVLPSPRASRRRPRRCPAPPARRAPVFGVGDRCSGEEGVRRRSDAISPPLPRVVGHALDDRVDLVHSLLRRPRAPRGAAIAVQKLAIWAFH